ncbi:zinc finger protein-like 1 homolog [Prorops nasuta]|uniref:zinc finger protein-like 1 homolog n=1 Tax=Prorops nasuta TaxID=863751 RepID=UPI0034CF174F
MGLCKCPKRKVTNQFCFEHRVNVCEHCMVTNHPKCVVQSYLLWLHDHDYSPVCLLCSTNLSNEDCVRLTCYHMYHWSCLDKYAKNLPVNTAPAGYACPSCGTCIIPQKELVSPVADVLREKLASVNWGRSGLCLPLLSSDKEAKLEPERMPLLAETSFDNHMITTSMPTTATTHTNNNINIQNSSTNSSHLNNQKVGPPYAIVNIESSLALSNQASRKIYEAYDDPKDVSFFDHDENKYQRKSPVEWFLRRWKLIKWPTTRRRNTTGTIYKRYAFIIALGLLVFISIIILFSWLGRMATDGDPSYDLHANPNIRTKLDIPNMI